MSKVVTGASMSLDGFIAGPGETGFEHLFAWYQSGDVPIASTHPEIPFNLTPSDAAYLQNWLDSVGVYVVGKRLFTLTDGWGGIHPADKPIVVVTHTVPEQWIADHPDAPFTFVTGGVKAAIDVARGIAGDKLVGVSGGDIARQCLEQGLLEEISVDIVPVLLGGGVPLFGALGNAPVLLEDPEIIPGTRVTHLKYTIR
ncbi:dihydrofolate reductase family protein [Nocardia sp. CDC153]|uniref:dihydrofolate reductase family protein n=1 Tax=Nocardia sp. CDC153 TaxID=3112167 RepID=UPI002DC02E2B|nr:dihydrofolate reductase family protein [Nocardia sp. CDC153]MEC3956221.1 dihydrofolate reductase family protein [Nocardia sp. CDC153]